MANGTPNAPRIDLGLTRQGAIFTADDGVHGEELWITDGTEAGTQRLDHVLPGAGMLDPSDFTPLGDGRILLQIDLPWTGKELWVTDGTVAGTFPVMDIAGGAGSSGATNFLALGDGRAVFSANDGANGQELWITDGTTGGTRLVSDISAGADGSAPEDFALLGDGRAVFSADDGVNGRQLWITDGTAAGTLAINDGDPTNLTSLADGRVLFQNGNTLMMTDGTEAGTTALSEVDAAISPPYITEIRELGDGRAVILATTGSAPWGARIFVTDGTGEGTFQLTGADGTGLTTYSDFDLISLDDGRIIFTAFTEEFAQELWITDGTEAGTHLIKDINETTLGEAPEPDARSSFPSNLTRLDDGRVVFSARDREGGLALWVSDGTQEGTRPLQEIDAGSGSTTAVEPVVLPTHPTFTQHGGAVTLLPDAVLSGVDGGLLGSLSLTLADAPDGAAEVLAAGALPSGITARYDAMSHTLTLSGLASVAGYQAALNAITYDNNAVKPDESPRSLVLTVIDEDFGSSSRSFDLAVRDADLHAGTNWADRIDVGAGRDVVRAGNGWDVIIGNGDWTADTYDGGASFDTIDYTAITLGLTADLVGGTVWSLQTGLDTVVGFERFLFGSGDDQIFGSSISTLLSGGGGDDTITAGNVGTRIFGGHGSDTLYGGSDADEIRGGAGDDTLFGGTDLQKDTLDGGDGFDTLDFHGLDVDVAVNLGQGYTLGTGVDTITGFERVVGGSGDDRFVAGVSHAVTFEGGGGQDTLLTGSGNDMLAGGSGDDTIKGGAGFDRIVGGKGNDTLTGGFNADVFVFVSGFGNDTITDFDAGNGLEKIDLSQVSDITDHADLAANHLAQVGNDVVITDGANTITLQHVTLIDLDAGDFVF